MCRMFRSCKISLGIKIHNFKNQHKIHTQTHTHTHTHLHIYIYIYIQGVTGGTDQTSGECSLGQTIPIQPKTPMSKVEWLRR